MLSTLTGTQASSNSVYSSTFLLVSRKKNTDRVRLARKQGQIVHRREIPPKNVATKKKGLAASLIRGPLSIVGMPNPSDQLQWCTMAPLPPTLDTLLLVVLTFKS